MPSPVLHLRHPRRRRRSLCGLPLSTERPPATTASLSVALAIALSDSDGSQPACRDCLLELLATALPRYGVRFVDEYTTALDPERFPLWTGAPLRQRREAAGLTRAGVAVRSGLTESTLCNLERRRHLVSPRVIRQLMSLPRLGPDEVD